VLLDLTYLVEDKNIHERGGLVKALACLQVPQLPAKEKNMNMDKGTG
jgi:hypothetical protein